MSLVDDVASYVRKHREGLVFDLVFAVVWVTVVTVLFDLVNGPQWAYYLTMAAGVLAYYGFVTSLATVRESK